MTPSVLRSGLLTTVSTLAVPALLASLLPAGASAGQLFDAIAVSSDSAHILEIASACGVVHLVNRPAELATDTAAKLPVIRHCVSEVERVRGQTYNTLVDLDATSPLRSIQDIQNAVSLLETSGFGNVITAMPARHFSGRLFTRAQSLWSSFVYQTPHHKLYLGADSGYGKHFKEIGEQFGPFDLALLECGQYNDMWPYIHMKPEEVVTAAKDLKSKVLMPVHWGKFSLAMHPWNEPIQRVSAAAKENGMPITTPLIGEPVVIGGHYPDSIWWNFE
jgi:hypothetical protein